MAQRTTLALFVVAAIAAGAVAQTATPGTPVEGEAIVNRHLQVTGTVISSDDNRLIVQGDNGQQMTFIVNDETSGPRVFQHGDRVTASYVTLAGTGYAVTKVISIPPPVVTKSTAYRPPVETRAAAPAPVVASPAPPPPVSTAPAVTEATIDPEPADEVMPATASPLPLVGLIGFLAAAGAGAVRRFRRS